MHYQRVFRSFELSLQCSHKVTHGDPRASASQSRPAGSRKQQFSTVWSVFGVRRKSILVHRGDPDFRVFDPRVAIFDPPRGGANEDEQQQDGSRCSIVSLVWNCWEIAEMSGSVGDVGNVGNVGKY